MKYLILLLLTFNAYAHKYTIDYTNGKNWASQAIEGESLEDLKSKVDKFLKYNKNLEGEWNEIELNSFANKIEKDIEGNEITMYFHPSNFTFNYEDLTPIKAAQEVKRLRKKNLRDQALGINGKTKKDLNIRQLNEYLFE